MWIISSALLRDYENSRCSPEQAVEYSADTCSVGEPSAPLSGPHILRLYLPHDKMTDFSRLSRFGVMCKSLTENHGADVLMWYLAGFPVRISAQPEKAQESTANDPACGRTWQGLLARYDPILSLWKTPQCSLLEDSDVFSETWPRSGTMRNMEFSEAPALAHHTNVSDCGYWPTPLSGDNRNRGSRTGKGQVNLSHLLHKMERQDLQLSPTFREWLMGWPIGWTGLQPLGTAKTREWQQQHSLSFTGE